MSKQISGEREFQAEGKARSKALRWMHEECGQSSEEGAGDKARQIAGNSTQDLDVREA